jgi:hypothetical protein
MFLGVVQEEHENQSHKDKSGYDVLDHGYRSTGLADYVVGDRAANDDERHGRGRQCAASAAAPST